LSQVRNPIEAAQAQVGRVLRQRWRLDALLGCGGVGAVFAATHRTGSQVAVKMLHPHLVTDADLCRRFLREAYVANRVRHPGVVSVLDDDVDDDKVPFLVMELLQGATVEERAAASAYRMDPREALWIADRLLDVLAAAHEVQVIHRDVKPENVFLTRDGRLKVLDFGIAQLREGEKSRTAEGIVMGTVSFMAPEQARGQWSLVDRRADIFAVGATLFAVLTGGRLHGEGTAMEQFRDAMAKPAPRTASVAPHLPADVAALVDTALAFERERRFPTAAAMQAAVRSAYQACAGVGLAPAEWAAVIRPSRHHGDGADRPVAIGDGSFSAELSIEIPAVEPPTPGASARMPAESRSDAPTLNVPTRTEQRIVAVDVLADGLVNRGRAKHQAGDLAGAILDYGRAIDLSPRHALAYFNRGITRQQQGDSEEALLDYGRAIERSPDFAHALHARAALLASRGIVDRARADAERAVEVYRAEGNETGASAAAALLAGIAQRA
jgi:serine/threonine-protein kinase